MEKKNTQTTNILWFCERAGPGKGLQDHSTQKICPALEWALSPDAAQQLLCFAFQDVGMPIGTWL